MRGATTVIKDNLIEVYDISIHAPHARSDIVDARVDIVKSRFQSTLLMRGATNTFAMVGAIVMDFNPRSSCEERPVSWSRSLLILYFNPRSSCEERRCRGRRCARNPYFNPRSSCEERRALKPELMTGAVTFQSTLLMRGATSAG